MSKKYAPKIMEAEPKLPLIVKIPPRLIIYDTTNPRRRPYGTSITVEYGEAKDIMEAIAEALCESRD